jgi:hypothetical protein
VAEPRPSVIDYLILTINYFAAIARYSLTWCCSINTTKTSHDCYT